jgi:hypothetical protein
MDGSASFIGPPPLDEAGLGGAAAASIFDIVPCTESHTCCWSRSTMARSRTSGWTMKL